MKPTGIITPVRQYDFNGVKKEISKPRVRYQRKNFHKRNQDSGSFSEDLSETHKNEHTSLTQSMVKSPGIRFQSPMSLEHTATQSSCDESPGQESTEELGLGGYQVFRASIVKKQPTLESKNRFMGFMCGT